MASTANTYINTGGILDLAIHTPATTTTTTTTNIPIPDDKVFFRQHDNHNDPKPAVQSDEQKALQLDVNKLFIELFFISKKGNELSQEEVWVLYKGLVPNHLRIDPALFGRLRTAYHTKGNFSLKLKEDDAVAVTASDSTGTQRTMIVRPTTPPKYKKKADGKRYVTGGVASNVREEGGGQGLVALVSY